MHVNHNSVAASYLILVMPTADRMTGRYILAENLARLIEAYPQSQDAIGKRADGTAQSTIDRMTGAESSSRIDSVEKVARAFGLELWQILVPNLDPKRLPRLDDLSAGERLVIDTIRQDKSGR